MIAILLCRSCASCSRSTVCKFCKFDVRFILHLTYSGCAAFDERLPLCKHDVIHLGLTLNFLNAGVFVRSHTPPTLGACK